MCRKLFLLLLLFPGWILPEDGLKPELRKSRLDLTVDVGIDHRERRYYSPRFDFMFPLRSGDVFLEVYFQQWMNGRLQGRIDYWINAGFRKAFENGFLYSFRLNHFCRHEALRQVDRIFNLNEVLALAGGAGGWGKIEAGGGFYLGGDAPYKSLGYIGLDLPRFPLKEIRLHGEARWVDFREWLHDIGLYLRLARGTELFLRNIGAYSDGNMTLIGLRLTTAEGNPGYLDTVGMNIGVSPDHTLYKIGVDGVFRIALFEKELSRILIESLFYTPLLNGDSFFGKFQPDRMVYGVHAEYQKLSGKGFYAFWYGQYRLDLPVDKETSFNGELGTGLGVRNQADFYQLQKSLRFEVRAGVNFKKRFDLSLKLGGNAPPGWRIRPGADVEFRMNRWEQFFMARLFLAFAGPVSIRPFVSFDSRSDQQRPELSHQRYSFGVSFFTWPNRS